MKVFKKPLFEVESVTEKDILTLSVIGDDGSEHPYKDDEETNYYEENIPGL